MPTVCKKCGKDFTEPDYTRTLFFYHNRCAPLELLQRAAEHTLVVATANFDEADRRFMAAKQPDHIARRREREICRLEVRLCKQEVERVAGLAAMAAAVDSAYAPDAEPRPMAER